MPFLKRILLSMLVPVLPLVLFGIAFSFGFNQAVGSPESVKEILSKSGIYENLIPNVLNNAQKESGGEFDIALTDPRVKEAAEKAFTPAFVEQSSEEIIDGTFAWLNGEAKMPTFNIDLSSAKTAFANATSASAEQTAATLPRCGAGTSAADFDVFSATCLPAGITPASAAARVQNDILNGQGFLENSSINADSLKSENSNQSVFAQMESVPETYQQVKKLPIYLAILAIILVAGIIFLSTTRRAGIRRVGIILLVVGIIMLILSWIVGGQVVERIKIEDSVLSGDLKNLLKDIADVVAGNYRLFGGLYAVLGLAAIAGSILINRSPRASTAPVTGHAELPQADRTPDRTVSDKPTPKTRTKKIQ